MILSTLSLLMILCCFAMSHFINLKTIVYYVIFFFLIKTRGKDKRKAVLPGVASANTWVYISPVFFMHVAISIIFILAGNYMVLTAL